MSDGKWARDDQEKTNTFAIHLFNTFQPKIIVSTYNLILHLNATILKSSFQPEENKCCNQKAEPQEGAGNGSNHNKHSAGTTQEGCLNVMYLFKTTIRLHYIPIQWKTVKIIMIHKLGKAKRMSQFQITQYRCF